MPEKNNGPKILFLDIETLPNISYTWGKYDQNVIEFKQQTCIATFAAKWRGGKVFSKALRDYPGYKPNSYNDTALVKDLWKIMDEADIIVAHNGDDFDFRVSRGRFIVHKLAPPSPFKTVDTKKVSRKVAKFNSNRMDDIGELLGLGRKIKTDFSLWRGCIEGDKKSWDQMIEYNERDVELLEDVYERLLPYIDNHPNLTLYKNGSCPKCGSKNIQYRGYAICSTRKYQRFQCKDCGGWGRDTSCDSSTVTTNAI